MTAFDWLWLVWLALFLPIELPGAIRKIKGSTLSAHVWWAFCFKQYGVGRPFWKTRRAIFGAFWLALTLHFVTGLSAWPWLIVSSIPFGLTFLISVMFERGDT